MNKKLIITLIVALVAIAGGAVAYLYMDDPKGTLSSSSQDQSSTSTADNIADVAGSSISKLLGAGIARKCTYSDQSSNGTLYLTNNNRMRVDYTMTDTEQGGNGGMIIAGNQQHIWDNTTKQGVVMSYTPSSDDSDTSSDGTTTNDDESVDMNQEYDFNCSLWVVDESLLTPPTDITFTDMSAFMQPHTN